jgi:Na+/pantothenate symporter
LLVLILAFTAPSMFDIWVWSADITGATLAVPILLGMCWKKPSHKAAMTAVVLGFVGWTLAQVGLVSWSPILLGSLLSLFGYLLVTIISPQKNNL